ncbi:MAG: hypothetical protein JWL72_343 [Ilumatobacteraceae bacterium]|nr:hypothetical protein [Ilumatobacteraceae bacterium]
MSWFRKKKSVEQQEDLLRDIVRGGTPIVATPSPGAAPSPSGVPFAAPPAPGQAPPGWTTTTTTVGAMGGGMGGEISASIGKAIMAIASHGDMLRARGIDPAQLQNLLQMRMSAGGGVPGQPIVITSGQNPFAGFATPPAGAAPHEDLVAALENLSQLHAAGSLSDEEFAAAKTKLLTAG